MAKLTWEEKAEKRIRHKKIRIIKFIPPARIFYANHKDNRKYSRFISMSLDEVESLRLKYKENLSNKEGGNEMGISNVEFKRLTDSAGRKLSNMIIEGSGLRIGDNDFMIRDFDKFKKENN